MANKSFWDHPIERLEEALSLKKQIHTLQTKLNNMFGAEDGDQPKSTSSGTRGGKRSFSAASRAKMAAAQKARWSKSARGTSTSTAKAAPRAKKGGMSPEGRERIAAAQRARWAKARGASVARASKPAQSKAPAAAAKGGKRTVSPAVRARLAAAMKARWAAAKRKGLPGPNARK